MCLYFRKTLTREGKRETWKFLREPSATITRMYRFSSSTIIYLGQNFLNEKKKIILHVRVYIHDNQMHNMLFRNYQLICITRRKRCGFPTDGENLYIIGSCPRSWSSWNYRTKINWKRRNCFEPILSIFLAFGKETPVMAMTKNIVELSTREIVTKMCLISRALLGLSKYI